MVVRPVDQRGFGLDLSTLCWMGGRPVDQGGWELGGVGMGVGGEREGGRVGQGGRC